MSTINFLKAMWGDDSREFKDVRLEYIPGFSARGMKRLYARADCFPSTGTFNMDVWRTREGRVLVRCWARMYETDDAAYEVFGWMPTAPAKGHLNEDEIPLVLKEAYAEWVDQEF